MDQVIAWLQDQLLGIFAGILTSAIVAVPTYIRSRTKANRLLNLMEMRDRGVDIRNRGSANMSPTGRYLWNDELDSWYAEMLAEARKVSKDGAKEIQTLDTYTPLVPSGLQDPKAVKRVTELTETLKRLLNLVRDHRS